MLESIHIKLRVATLNCHNGYQLPDFYVPLLSVMRPGEGPASDPSTTVDELMTDVITSFPDADGYQSLKYWSKHSKLAVVS